MLINHVLGRCHAEVATVQAHTSLDPARSNGLYHSAQTPLVHNSRRQLSAVMSNPSDPDASSPTDELASEHDPFELGEKTLAAV